MAIKTSGTGNRLPTSMPTPYGGTIPLGAPGGQGGGGFNLNNLPWWAKAGAAAGGAYLANRAGVFNPNVVDDPRNQAVDWFAKKMTGGADLGALLSGMGTLPGYQGPWSAGLTGAQNQAMGGMNSFFSQFFGNNRPPSGNGISQLPGGVMPFSQSGDAAPTSQSGGVTAFGDAMPVSMGGGMGGGGAAGGSNFGGGSSGIGQGQDIMAMLQGAASQNGLNIPPQLMAALNGAGAGNSFLQQMAGGTDPTSMALSQFAGMQPQGTDMIGNASQWLSQQMGNGTIQNLLQGGQSADIGQIASMLDAARQPGQNRDIANLRENFSFNGLRNSTDLNSAVAQRMAEGETGMMGQLAQIIPQLTGQSSQTSLGTLNAISNLAGTQGQLGQMIGNLGLGQSGQGLSALQSILGNRSGAAMGLNSGGLGVANNMSSLFNNQQGNALQALLAMPGAYQGNSLLPGQIASQLFGMGTTEQNNNQQGIQNRILGFNQQQSLIPQLLGFLGGTPQQQVTPSTLAQLAQLGIGAAAVKQGK